jgi:hypothetical protein
MMNKPMAPACGQNALSACVVYSLLNEAEGATEEKPSDCASSKTNNTKVVPLDEQETLFLPRGSR